MRMEDWHLLSWLDFLKVIELVIVILSMGFVIGYVCAIKVERVRIKNLPADGDIAEEEETSETGTQSKEPMRRTFGAKSQGMNKKMVTPRYHVWRAGMFGDNVD